jgi:hypothetical protein
MSAHGTKTRVKSDLRINLKTAQALGLTAPADDARVRRTKVIEYGRKFRNCCVAANVACWHDSDIP